MTSQPEVPSARQAELLELAYAYALRRGRTDLTLRPIAAAIGSSPRVLLYLFGSKEGLIRALLGRARADEVAMLAELRRPPAGRNGGPSDQTGDRQLPAAILRVWSWLATPAHRPLLRLWLDGYARGLSEPDGVWAGFGAATVVDWLALLRELQPPAKRDVPAALAERTLLLAVLRGALLDLLATGDEARTTAAVERLVSAIAAS